MYAKGSRYYEDEPVYRSSMEDIDLDFVAEYCKKIGYQKSAVEYIRQNNEFVIKHNGREEMSSAAILLFGKNPQLFFKRARVRFIRYDGIEAKVGTEMNVINSIAHRNYSIKETDIQIKMFNDRITVESPGILPGIVRLNNLRTVHFSRNPNIARFLHEYDYVQEFGEGIDRMFNEMAATGLPAPEYRNNAFMLNATIRNGVINEVINGAINISAIEQAVLAALKKKPRITKVELQKETSFGKSTIDRAIKALKEKCLIERVGSNKTGYWKVINKGL